jgi:peptidylprolyl isomerase
MPVKEGDFLLVNYTLKVKESGETVDTTFDTVAKEARIHREDNVYEPKFVVIGEAFLPKGLEELLVGTEPGTKRTIELAPEKGYGAREPGKMRLLSLRRFREKGIEPVPGRQMELDDGKSFVVRSVGAGRVQVDYNHPLAGRTLVYDISIEKVMEDRDDKILSLVSRRIPEVTKDKFNITYDEGDLTIEVPEEAFYLKGLQVAKNSVTADVQKYFPRINTIAFREVYKRGTPEAKAEGPEVFTEQKSETEEAEPKTAAKKPERTTPKKSTGRKSTSTTSKRRAQKSKTGTEEETE